MTMKQLDRLLFKQGSQCFFCRKPLEPIDASVEHLVASANWTYGLSVLVLNDASLAPLHPIPKAQAAIAAALKKNFPDR
jgi:hypothetical protein